MTTPSTINNSTGFLKSVFETATITVGAFIPMMPLLYATIGSDLSVPDISVINGFAMGISFCASMAVKNRGRFNSLAEAYTCYSNKGIDSYVAVLGMPVVYGLMNYTQP